jgi:hypothetical protein
MVDKSTTIRERVAEAIKETIGEVGDLFEDDDYLEAADAAIAIVVEVFRNGQASLLEEERKDERP